MIHHDELDPQAAEGAIDHGPDPMFAAFLAGVTDQVDSELERSSVPWDFAAMLARAHAIDPTSVSEEAVREAELAEPVISLAQRRASRSTAEDPAFARLVADVRAATEHDVALRSNGIAITPPVAARPRGRGRSIVIAAFALAAAVLLVFGAVQGVQFLDLGRNRAPDEAVHQEGGVQSPVLEAIVDDEPAPRTSAREKTGAPTPIVEPIAEPIVPEAAPLETTEAPKVAARPRRKSVEAAPVVAPPQPTVAERQKALTAEATRAWTAGDLKLAASKFEEVIALSGKSRLADQAWGDLFNIAHKRGDTRGEIALWKRYIASLPRGAFADIARAGLCRRDAADKAACWREYLADFPKGLHAADAERAIGSAP